MTSEPRIAYLILVHNDPDQLERLVSALDHRADFFVHIDAKTDASAFRKTLERPNVFQHTNRVKVYWAGFSIVEATLHLMSEAVRHRRYDRLVLLNGLDYPIKPVAAIVDKLLGAPQSEFIRFFDVERARSSVYLDLLVHYHFHDAPRALVNKYYDIRKKAERLLKPIRRPLLKPYVHCFGHMQWAITGDCAAHILEHVSANPRLSRFYRYAFAPDERFFHTIVANSPFCEAAGGIEPYEDFGTFRMANLHHIHPSLNKTYTETDFDELAASDKFFVKKITSEDSLALVRMIDEKLR